MSETILKVDDLRKYFPIKGGILQKTVGNVKAVDGISFEIKRGETLGIVGESGCGKSTTGRAVLRLTEKTSGSVFYKGEDIHKINDKKLRSLRTDMQIVFQDPYSSLNPRMTVGDTISEAMIHHGLINKKEAREAVLEVMDVCGLSSYQIDRYPHEFSGGQRQRIGIARALALDPSFVVLDEPVSALDVSIQAQIINLLTDLQEKKDLTYMFISHDLGVVEHLSTSVGVMYLGIMVEKAEKAEIYKNPLHPYTKALFSAIPVPDPTLKKKRIILTGDIPSPSNPPSGCKFHTRCPYTKEICKTEEPRFKDVGGKHFVACHLV
ncbi:dipeptide ABC transporter ATP-binding protein [Clostridium sp.]|uniref:ABC transporter ATP-binding protein n=1 Tax=Clostridium sp. TaxID=1506 RepID=UPI002625DD61|nr:dipeptide ABC transporter ATP-binding protein [Clostridium sp.]